jgi:hypothetical protein
MKNSDGIDECVIKERWKEYFENLLNEENPRMPTEECEPNQGVVRDIEERRDYRSVENNEKWESNKT